MSYSTVNFKTKQKIEKILEQAKLFDQPEACSPRKESRCSQPSAAEQTDKKEHDHNTNIKCLLTTQFSTHKP